MISEFISVIVGIVIGQDAAIPRLAPLLNELYVKCIELMNTRTGENGSLKDTFTGWFKQDE